MKQRLEKLPTALITRILLLAAAYFVGGKLGLSIPYVSSSITLFWPPSGIALAALLVWRLSCWPGIFLGALAINLSIGHVSLLVAMGIAFGNTIGPVVGALLLKRTMGFQNSFVRGCDVTAFLLIGPGSMFLTASIGVFELYVSGNLSTDLVAQAWLGWWLGDTVGVLVFTPLLLLCTADQVTSILRSPLRTRLEFILVLGSCIFLVWLVFGGISMIGQLMLPLAFLVFPSLIWIGLRFNPLGAYITALAIALLAVIGTAKGTGPFSRGDPQLDQLILCIFVATTTLISLMMIGIQAERRRAEQNLRDSESRLRLALTAANQGLYDLNIQTGEAIVSPEYALMLGYDPQSFVETDASWLDRMHPEDRDPVYQIYNDYITGLRKDYQVEFRQLTQQGEWKWILSLGKVIEWDHQGRSSRMLGTHTDISDRKAKELILQQSEEALLRAQALAKLGSWHFNLKTDELTWSKEAFQIFGIENNAPLTYEGFLACIIPEDRERVNLAWQAALKGATYDIEHRINMKGQIKWIRERAEITVNSVGQLVEALGTVEDISNRKQAEEEINQAKNLLRTVIDATPDWIFVKDKQHRFVLVNQAFADSQGLAPTAMLGRPDTDFWAEYLCYGDAAKNFRGFHADDIAALAGEKIHNIADHAILTNGKLRWLDIIKLPLRNTISGEIIGIVGYARDITDRLSIESKYRTLVEQIPAVTYTIAINSADIHAVYVSPQIQSQLGFSVKEWLDNPRLWVDQIHPDDRQRIMSSLSVSLITGAPYYSEYRIYKKDGSIAWVRDDAAWLKDADGKPKLLQGVMLDITHQRQTEDELSLTLEELRTSEKYQRELRTLAEREQSRIGALLSAMSIGILFEDDAQRVEYVNPAFLRIWNISAHENLLNELTTTVLARSTKRFTQPAHASQHVLNVIDTHEVSKRLELELNDGRMLTQLSYPVNDIEGRIIGRLWMYEDITQERQTAQQLLYLAEHDPLTGLYNRHRFQKELNTMIATSLRNHHQFALLYFDLDDFKYINDTFGHRAGDTVLVRTAGEISTIVRHIEVFARLGGDEFAILSMIQPHDDISVLPARIVASIAAIPLRFRGTNIRLTTSVGIATFPEHGETAEDLVAHADAAMYQAKNHGKNTWAIYDPARDSSEIMMHRMTWYNRIAQALERDLFEIHFQGIYETTDNTLSHLEILVRMRNPNEPNNLIMPGQFIPIAEKNGQIANIDRWVIKRSIELLHQNPDMPPAAINISGRTFDDPAIPLYIRGLLNELNVDPGRLIIELTETAAVSDIQDAQRFIEAVHQTGCRVCLDDFGSGFSTFGYLKYLSVEILKIDGLFIHDLPNNRDNQIFVKAMAEVARGLGKIAVAEFVEDAATLEMVKNLGIELAQGYYFGCPSAEIPGKS